VTLPHRLAGLVLACLACAPANAGAAPGGTLAAACASCHDVRPGNPRQAGAAIASLAAMDEASIAHALRDYRSGSRKNQIMQVVVGALSQDDIGDVAREIASRPQEPGR